MVRQGEIPIASFHIRAGPLEHLRERFGLGLECVLLHRAQHPKDSIGLKQWGAEALSKRTQWLTCRHGASRGHALEVVRRNQMRMHREGLRWCRICRKFSLEAICGMVSPGDPRYKEKESDHGGELQGGPFPQGYHPDGCALVRRVPLELSACRRTDGGARG